MLYIALNNLHHRWSLFSILVIINFLGISVMQIAYYSMCAIGLPPLLYIIRQRDRGKFNIIKLQGQLQESLKQLQKFILTILFF